MTDAERIAEYLNEQECGNPWTANDVERRIADPSTQCHDLARLLSDVRREEREAETARCLDILIRVGISAMEAGHTNVGKYIAAASTQIRGTK